MLDGVCNNGKSDRDSDMQKRLAGNDFICLFVRCGYAIYEAHATRTMYLSDIDYTINVVVGLGLCKQNAR